MAKEAKKYFGDKVELKEYKFIQKESIARAKKLEITHIPCILINGEVKYSSIIPSKEELIQEIQKKI